MSNPRPYDDVPGTTDCDGRCSNLQNDNINCGACFHRCEGNQTCEGGACVLHCGDIEDLPVLTCTAAEGQAEVRAVAPSIEYLRWVVVGLHESWKLSPTKIAEYLHEAPGISLSYHSTAELEEAVRRSLEAA